MQLQTLKNILEALLLSADRPMDIRRLDALFEADEDRPSKDEIRQALEALQEDYQDRGIQLKEVASGYRMQVVESCASWVARLWEEKPPRYSRALLETLVLIAYRQPITRGEIEDIRGVSVSSHIMKTLLEREWVRVLGHKDVPGKPAMYGTTREFLDYFSLRSLDELPALSDIKDLDKLHPELALDDSAEANTAEADEQPADGDPAVAPADTGDNDAPAAEQAAGEDTDATLEDDSRAQRETQPAAAEDEAEAGENPSMAGAVSEPAEAAMADSGSAEAVEDAVDPADATVEPRDQAPDETGEQDPKDDSDGVSEDDQRAGREMQTG